MRNNFQRCVNIPLGHTYVGMQQILLNESKYPFNYVHTTLINKFSNTHTHQKHTCSKATATCVSTRRGVTFNPHFGQEAHFHVSTKPIKRIWQLYFPRTIFSSSFVCYVELHYICYKCVSFTSNAVCVIDIFRCVMLCYCILLTICTRSKKYA